MTRRLRITAKRDGFRRAGMAHPRTPTEYDYDYFTEEQLDVLAAETLKDNPMLIIEGFDAEDFDEGEGDNGAGGDGGKGSGKPKKGSGKKDTGNKNAGKDK